MKILTSWDDASHEDLKIAELLKKYNLPGIFYWPVNLEKSKNMKRVKKWLSLAECKEIAQSFEVGSHTITHQWLSELNTKQARNEIFDSRKFWQDQTGQEINTFCYPRNKQNTIVRMLVKNAGYTSARTTIVGHLDPGQDLFQTPTTVHVGVDRVEYKDKSWEIFAREMLEKADENSIYHLFGHGWEIEASNDWKHLETLFKELSQWAATTGNS